LSFLTATIALLDVLWLDVTWVTVALLGIAVSPWLFSLERLHRYIKTVELPGGLKLALRDASLEAENIELEQPTESLEIEVFLETIQQNPNLTLVGIRLELERLLRQYARKVQIYEANKFVNIRRIMETLLEAGHLKYQEYSLLQDLWPTLNRAAHSEHVDTEAQAWAISAARPLINNLEARLSKLENSQNSD